MNGESFFDGHRFRTGVLFFSVLAVGVVNARGALSVGSVCAEQPAWWNDVVLVKLTGKVERAEACWNWMQANNPPAGKPFDNCYAIGPFDGEKGAALHTPYPPEKAVDRAPVRGAGSRLVAWQAWPAGTPCPLTNRIPDTIAYATRKITVNAPSSGGFTVSSRAGYRLWVDGQPVVTNGAAGNGQYVPLRLNPGAHTILVKAYLPDGDWAWSANWAAVDPRCTEIKSRSLVVSLWPRDETALRAHAPRLAALYLDLEDTVNGRYWVGCALTACRTNAPEVSAMIGSWVVTASKNAVAGAALSQELGRFLGRLPKQDPLRPSLVDAVYDLGLALACPDETALLLRAAGVKPTPERALRMAQVSRTSNMVDSVSFWIEPYLKDFQTNGPAGYSQFSQTVADWLQQSTDTFRQALYDSIERVVTVGSNDDLRAILADCYMRDVLARVDTGRAAQFLKDHAAALAMKRSFEVAFWRLQVAVMENNEAAARAALDAAVLARPAFTNSADFSKYREILFKFNATVTLPASVELAPDEVPASVDRLVKAGNNNRLCVYLRDVLRARGDSTVPVEGDPNLFVGAKPYYRRMLAAYAPVYEAWLRKELAVLTAEPFRQEEARRLDRIAHLAPPAVAIGSGVAAGVETMAGSPISASGFVPLLDMTPGLPEVIEDQLRYMVKAAPAPAASLTVRGGDAWLANSRMLACLRGGAVVWSWAAPLPCSPPQHESRPPNFRMGGRCEPAPAGDIVAVRILLPDATPAVIALDRGTGAHRWTWRPDKGILAGAPASWGTNRLVILTVTKDDMGGYRTDLVVLDTRGGELAAVHLGGRKVGGPIRWIDDRSIDPDSFWQTPPPVVDGDIAYVSTSLGLVGAVNLADESILWLRNYSHYYDDGVTGFRVPRAPVVGRNTVLFAPPDSNRLMLIDKATGRLVASRTDLAWTEVAPCGPDAAVVLTPSLASVFSLADLSERRLSAGRSFGIVQPVREGCLLAERNGALTLCGADGKLTAMAPASDSVRLLGRGPDGICYGAGGPGGQWCGVVGNRAGPAPGLVRPQRNLPPLCDMALGVLVGTGGDVPLVSSGLTLMGVGADGRRLWELPSVMGNGLVAYKGRVVVARGGRAWVYDERTADLLGTWPAGFGSTESVRVVVAAPEGGYAIGPGADQRMTLWSLATDGVVTGHVVAQWAPNAIGDFISATVIPTATQFVAMVRNSGDESSIWTAPRRTSPAVFDPAFGKLRPVWLWTSGDGRRASVLTHTPARLIVADTAGLREIALDFNTGWITGVASSGDLILSYRERWTPLFLNPATGASLKLAGTNVYLPTVIGTRIYGLKATITGTGTVAKIEKLQPYTCAVDGRNQPVLGAPLPAWVSEKSVVAGTMVDGAGFVTLILGSPVGGVALAWQGTVARDPYRLPVIPAGACAWSTPQGVVNVGGVWMSPTQWQSVLHLSNTVHLGMATSRVVSVDGFLDEWPTNAFFNIPLGRMAACVSEAGEFGVAIEIQDAAMAERLGVEGLDERLTITAEKSRSVCLVESPPPSLRPTLKPFQRATINGQDVEFAWTVTPDGRCCRIEATVSGIPFDLKNTEEAQAWGNVAVRLLWRRNLFEEPVNLVANGSWGPLSYVRVKF